MARRSFSAVLGPVLAAALLPLVPCPADAEPVDLELVLAVDGSGSIDEDEFALQRRGYAEAITSSPVLRAIAAGRRGAIALAFVEWAAPDSVHTVVEWTVIRGPADAAGFAARLLAAPRLAVGFNSISEAIAHSTRLIETNAYEGARKVIDVSGDGPQINGRPLPLMRAAALNAGITINALLIRRPGGARPGPRGEPLGEHYLNDVIGGFGAFLMTVEAEQNFTEAIRKKMVQEIADVRPTGVAPINGSAAIDRAVAAGPACPAAAGPVWSTAHWASAAWVSGAAGSPTPGRP